MAAPDARTRNKIALNPYQVRSSSIPTDLLPQIFLSNLLFALALHASKEWLLNFDVGIFWVTLRVLAIGGLVVLIKEGYTGELANKKSIEVRVSHTLVWNID
jgi:solute carrier family 30 (zinc transporter), member 5/7